MHDVLHALLWVLWSAVVVFSANVKVADVTLRGDFDRLVGMRNDVWLVVFIDGTLSEVAESHWFTAASELKELVRFGKVNCDAISSDSGHAGAPCARAATAGKEKVLGYSFNDKGVREVSSEAYSDDFRSVPLVKWARRLAPRLQVQLTSVRMEQLGEFLKRPRIVKALIFPKSEYAVLVTALALRFRQQVLVGEVKPTDGNMRKAFSVKALESMIVIDSSAKRHVYKGAFTRAAMETYLTSFTSDSLDADSHLQDGLEAENFKSQSYSEAETATYPKGFDPFRVLGLPSSKTVPAKDKLKSAYKEAAKRWHPDKCQTDKTKCEKRMSETALANTVLSDGRRLQQWEAWREDEAKQRSYGGRLPMRL